LREAGVEEHTISVIRAVYVGATTSLKVNGNESNAFEVKVGVHQGSVLSPLLFINNCVGRIVKEVSMWLATRTAVCRLPDLDC
jgi:hypothetical protein